MVFENESLALTDQQCQLAMLEEFLSQNYEFRRNIISDTYEIREINNGVEQKAFRPLTKEARNSILRRIKMAGIEVDSLSQNLDEFIYSEETKQFNPAGEYLDNLPKWDGRNHIGMLFGRIPGMTTEQHGFAATWLRSGVAHWLGLDTIHGNECVITLIGPQGCGKSTFCHCLLPPHLRVYYLDHLNLGNKNDKEMALTNNMLVNLDELDQIKTGQHAELKQALSKVQVNGRPIYGRAQKCRRRFASFVSTTNNLHPLADPTGSRRYLCIRIPDGELIDNDTPIDYEQLYAQVVYEVKELGMRYWFTNEETKRIEELNQDFQRVMSLESMVDACFRHPKEGEIVTPMLVGEILSELRVQYPSIQMTDAMHTKLGRLLKNHNYEQKHKEQGNAYLVVPKYSGNAS
ncbi:MAG: DUF3874 domain-containing protein [Bacteroidaceae bacterium]|nr:DUF3874 domain-containing protein [Bacteroidaceae bacterium]